jgi:hypothetical protein
MELVKRQDRYDLYGNDGSKIASSAKNPFGKLSKQNCDEIFGVVDVERLANETFTETNPSLKEYEEGLHIGFKEGFNKAMELNKDKLFTVEDMRQAYDDGMNNTDADGCAIDDPDKDFLDTLRWIQQPTEIEVTFNPDEKYSNGCLILKKK